MPWCLAGNPRPGFEWNILLPGSSLSVHNPRTLQWIPYVRPVCPSPKTRILGRQVYPIELLVANTKVFCSIKQLAPDFHNKHLQNNKPRDTHRAQKRNEEKDRNPGDEFYTRCRQPVQTWFLTPGFLYHPIESKFPEPLYYHPYLLTTHYSTLITPYSPLITHYSVTYSTPYTPGNSYTWNASHGNPQICFPNRNCLTLTWDFPCGIINPGYVKVTETNPATGCSTTATKWITITP